MRPRRKRITSLCFVLLTAVAGAADRPNIVVITADDLGFSDLGCYGSEIPTPNLDRLGTEGMRFTQFYNCGVGVMTRAALHTGLYPRPDQRGSVNHPLRSDMVTLAEVLRQAGYATVLTGKWQLGVKSPNRPNERGFDEFYGPLDGMGNHFDPARPEPEFWAKQSWHFAHNDREITGFPADFYSTDAFTEHATGMIRRLAGSSRPFFLSLNYTAPHFPIQAREEDVTPHRGKYQDGYEPMREARFRRQLELGIFDAATARLAPASLDYLYEYPYSPRNEVVPWENLQEVEGPPARVAKPWGLSRELMRARMEVYAAMVSRLDHGVGRVLAALEETGSARNTVVFFLSDNGGCATFAHKNARLPNFASYNYETPVGDARSFQFVGSGWGWAQNTPFRRQKLWTYEGGICTPMIAWWPGKVAAGRIDATPGHVLDFMPTVLEIAGSKYPDTVQGKRIPAWEGRSLLPILRGQPPRPRPVPLGWELYGNRAFRDGRWKLVWQGGHGTWELYDLAADRTETVDLADRHPERVAAMAAGWKRWAGLTGAPER